MGSCVSRDLFTSAHKDCPMPQGTDPLNPDLPSGCTPIVAVDHVPGKDKQMDFCWDPWQRCFQTTNGYLSDSRSCRSNYNVAALATSSLVGVVQSIKDHITKPTAMARGHGPPHRVEGAGVPSGQAGSCPQLRTSHCCLPDELREPACCSREGEEPYSRTHLHIPLLFQIWRKIYLQHSLPSGSPQDGWCLLLRELKDFQEKPGQPGPEEQQPGPQEDSHGEN
nr:protein FAM131C [Chlorocebus sabaeus]